jgi:cysteine desulfurase
MIYLDNNATTRPAAEVLDAMNAVLQSSYGNASSAYTIGREARTIIDDSRTAVADLIGAANPSEIVFTSCGTESDNWAILGALAASGKKHIVTTTIEHDAVRKLCKYLETKGVRTSWIEVDEAGSLDLGALRTELSEDTAVVSTMLANNETGILFPMDEIGEIVKTNSNALFHVDGVNAVGKIPIDLRNSTVDLFSLSAHKFHGPKGIGALYIREGVELKQMFYGGGQESARRPGTEAVHQIAGIGAAAKFVMDLTPMEKVRSLRDRLESAILQTVPNACLTGTDDAAKRLPNTSNICFANTNGEMILHYLNERGIYVSTGSACNARGHVSSAVLQAMNVPYSRAMGAIRFSLGRCNSEAEVDEVIKVLPTIISDLRRISG